MSKSLRLTALCGLFVLPLAHAQDSAGVALDTDQKRMSYAIGLTTAQSIVRQGVVLDLNTFMVGVADAMDGSKPRLSQAEFQAALEKASSSVNESLKNRAKTNLDAGQAFMKENAKQAGVTALSNGLQYKELRKGTGEHPKVSDTVKVHYEGKLLDGTIFDSSIKRNEPIEFPVNGVIAGWTEALQRMKVGDKWILFIPPGLAYGEQGSPPDIGSNELLTFEVELLDVK